jgi:hypothetical protein
VNASNRASLDAIGNAFTNISNNRVRHSVLPLSLSGVVS